jgi:hypothetical protein
VPDKKTFVCKTCNATTDTIKNDDNTSTTILQNFRYVRLQNLATKICAIDGILHQYVSMSNGENKCIKCSKSDNYIYPKKELDEIEHKLDEFKKEKNKADFDNNDQIKEQESMDKTYEDKVISNVNKSLESIANKSNGVNSYNFINILLDEIQGVIGNETSHGSNTYLRENAYIINHDHLGYPLDKPVIISDNDNKIFSKQNHPVFKTDVIYYSSYKGGKIETYYDATTYILLGYKEENKNVVINKKPDKRIIVNFSIFNKLKVFGYSQKHIDVSDKYDDIFVGREDIMPSDLNMATIKIVNDLLDERVRNLKKTIYEIHRLLSRLINSGNNNASAPPVNEHNESSHFADKLNKLIEKYKKKLVTLKLTDESGNHQIFKHWKGIVRGICSTLIVKNDLTIDFSKYKIVEAELLNTIDTSGRLVLFYITSEMTKLLKYNTQKSTKTELSYFMIDFINTMYDMFNKEYVYNNIDIKRFMYVLKSASYINEVGEHSGIDMVEGFYGEYIDPDEQPTEEDVSEQDDLVEEADALDIDLSDSDSD